jgi:hypothetical protein
MKRFKAVDFSLNPHMKTLIDKEVKILKEMNHENVVKFFDLLEVNIADQLEQRFYIITEYYEVSIVFLRLDS